MKNHFLSKNFAKFLEETHSLLKKETKLSEGLEKEFLGLVGFEPTTPCVGNTDSKSTELQA